jgi:hypothetical protein
MGNDWSWTVIDIKGEFLGIGGLTCRNKGIDNGLMVSSLAFHTLTILNSDSATTAQPRGYISSLLSKHFDS